jgi:RHS repeat-associated protein
MVNPQSTPSSTQGGQCPNLYRYEGGEHTIILFDPSTGAELDRYTAIFPANVFGTDLQGPINNIYPNSGDIFGGHGQGYVTVNSVDPTFSYLGRTFQFEPKPTGNWAWSKCIRSVHHFSRVDGQPDNCGNVPSPPQQTPSNPPPGQPSCPVTQPANSAFDVHTGAVTESVDLVTYQSLGETRGLALSYSSLTADPRPILHFSYSQVYNANQTIVAKLAIQRGSFSYQVPGYPSAQYGLTGGENFWSVLTAGSSGYTNGVIDAALQADLSTQPSGQYQYTLARGVQYIDPNAPSFSPLGATETATFIHVNRVNSYFGAGWALAGWQEIIENPDGSVLLLDGDGTQLLFGAPPSTGSPYSSPTGDFSTLIKLGTGTYQRTLKDQTVYAFNAQRRLASVRDRNGNLTQYTYNASGQLTQITDPVNLKTTFTYTSNRVTQIKDPANRITKLEYNATGDLIKLTHPDNAVWQWAYSGHRMTASIDPRNNQGTFQYDFSGRATSATRRDGSTVSIQPVAVKGLSPANQSNTFTAPGAAYRWPDAQANSPSATYTDANGRQQVSQVNATGSAVVLADGVGTMQSYQYNAQNLVQGQTNGRGQVTNYSYDSRGNVVQVTDTLSGTAGKQYTYDPTFNQLATVTDELGRQTLYDIDPANGNVRSMNQVVGAVGGTDDQITRYTYTAQGLISTITDALGRITAFTYNAQGRTTQMVTAQGTADAATLKFVYDSAGNLTTLTNPRNFQTKFFYAPFNRLIRTEESDPDGTGPQTGPITRYTYDPNGNLTQVQDARGNTTTYEYDTLNRLTKVTQPDPDGAGPLSGPITSYQYDAVGNLRFVTDPLNHVTEYQYDARNRLIKLIDPKQGQVQFEYDLDNNVTAVTDPINNRTVFSHDARSRLISEVNALNKTRSYSYNAVNNLTSRIDRNNRTINFEYDDLNRLKKETWVGSSQQVNLTYDLVGNVQSLTDLFSALTFAYDNQNRVTSIDNVGTPNSPRVVLAQTYDAASNRLRLTDTINAQLNGTEAYVYDAINRLTRITQSGTGVQPKRVDMGYSPVYQLETLTRFSNTAGTQTVAVSRLVYDALNRLTQLAHTQGITTTSINTYSYGYDAASRIIQMTSVDGTNSYSYDDTDQLTGATYNGQSNEAYSYDLNGNRTNAGYQTTTNNRLQSDGVYNFVYDDEGNLTQRTTIATNEVTEYSWDYRNRLTQVTVKNAASVITKQVNFTYDALNRRIEKRVDPDGSGPQAATIERFVYDRDHIKLVFTGSNTLIRRYLHGPMIDQVLADENVVPKQISWPLSDHQGTVRDLVNNSGVIQNHVRYDSFGKIVSQTAPALTPRFAYTGREWDGEIGLYFYRARYYDPGVGRFIGEDSIGFSSGDENLYRYVSNSPTDSTDPFGQQTWPSLPGLPKIPIIGPSPILPATPDPCLQACILENLGLGAAGGTAFGLGQPTTPTRVKVGGRATPGTSIASEGLSKLFPQKLPFRVPAPTGIDKVGRNMKTKILGRALGRWVPYVGAGLLLVDAGLVANCTAQCKSKDKKAEGCRNSTTG